MTPEELTELDTWIARNVLGWKFLDRKQMGWNDGPTVWSTGENPDEENSNPTWQNFTPTQDPAAAMMVLKKCVQELEPYEMHIDLCNSKHWGISAGRRNTPFVTAEVLELAICLFAKELFSEQTAV